MIFYFFLTGADLFSEKSNLDHLKKIVFTFGLPKGNVVGKIFGEEYKNIEEYAMTLGRPKIRKDNIKDVLFSKIDGLFDDKDMDDFGDLFMKMVKVNPEKRISTENALKHPFFDKVTEKYTQPPPKDRTYTPKPVAMPILQDKINNKMMDTLIDWMGEVMVKFKAETSTFILSIHLVKEILEMHHLERNNFQLLGVCSMLLASKLSENYSFTLSDMKYICDDAYKKEEIVKFEKKIIDSVGAETLFSITLHSLREANYTPKLSKKTYKKIMEDMDMPLL
jgi:serine/threonine protein kinase